MLIILMHIYLKLFKITCTILYIIYLEEAVIYYINYFQLNQQYYLLNMH